LRVAWRTAHARAARGSEGGLEDGAFACAGGWHHSAFKMYSARARIARVRRHHHGRTVSGVWRPVPLEQRMDETALLSLMPHAATLTMQSAQKRSNCAAKRRPSMSAQAMGAAKVRLQSQVKPHGHDSSIMGPPQSLGSNPRIRAVETRTQQSHPSPTTAATFAFFSLGGGALASSRWRATSTFERKRLPVGENQ